jgi:hypothetical protein
MAVADCGSPASSLLSSRISRSPANVTAQDRGAAALGSALQGLGVNTRVLMIGAHPDDEDTQIVAWLSRGRHIETAYLSLTRGDGGQNVIGNELGEGLGVIRTEELLAARRIDGARQYFTVPTTTASARTRRRRSRNGRTTRCCST